MLQARTFRWREPGVSPQGVPLGNLAIYRGYCGFKGFLIQDHTILGEVWIPSIVVRTELMVCQGDTGTVLYRMKRTISNILPEIRML